MNTTELKNSSIEQEAELHNRNGIAQWSVDSSTVRFLVLVKSFSRDIIIILREIDYPFAAIRFVVQFAIMFTLICKIIVIHLRYCKTLK